MPGMSRGCLRAPIPDPVAGAADQSGDGANLGTEIPRAISLKALMTVPG
jgi:hypothetical protein